MKRRRVFGFACLGGILIGVALTLLIDPLNAHLGDQSEFRITLALEIMKVPLHAYLIAAIILFAVHWAALHFRQPSWLNWPLTLLEGLLGILTAFTFMVRWGVFGRYALPSTESLLLVLLIVFGVQLIIFDGTQDEKRLPEPDLSDTEPVN